MDLRRVRDYLYGLWIQQELAKFHDRGGKIIMITGSYGKTSVRELTYDLLRQKYEVVETSRNYNTAVGIAKTLKWELMPTTQWLIIEVGAYRVGEIAEFAQWIRPDIGVITGIARQHLSRFGGWEQIKIAKTELARYIEKNGGVLVANGSDETVKELVKNASWYVGSSREEVNKTAARTIATECGMSHKEIIDAESHWRSVPSRFEITTDRYGVRVIDDSYNSNEKSFRQAVEYLGKQNKYTRIIVTPGLLELGDESQKIHEELGRVIAKNVDYVILVGKSGRTSAMMRGIGGKQKIVWINKTLDFMTAVNDLHTVKEPLVLLENDIPEKEL